MKNIVEIKNVKNVVTEEMGTMYLIASVDRNSTYADTTKHQGLSVFFQPEGDISPTYIKSFVFMNAEARLMRIGKINTIRDIGYFLDVQNLTMDIICLDSGMTNRIEDSNFGRQTVQRVVFSLEYTEIGYKKLEEEADKDSRHHKCGFRLAVSEAFGEMLNLTEDSIVPSIFPGEGNVTEFDYNLYF